MKASKILLQVINSYMRFPLLVTPAFPFEGEAWTVKGKEDYIKNFSLDGRLDRALSVFPPKQRVPVKSLVLGYLLSALAQSFYVLKPYKGFAQRGHFLQRFNDTEGRELQEVEFVLATAYMIALSEEDPGETSTLEQIKWANKYVASMPPDNATDESPFVQVLRTDLVSWRKVLWDSVMEDGRKPKPVVSALAAMDKVLKTS